MSVDRRAAGAVAAALGAALVLDNVVIHWWLGWHRLWPYPHVLAAELSLTLGGALLFAWGARSLRLTAPPREGR